MKNLLTFSCCLVTLTLIFVSSCKTKKQAPAPTPVTTTTETKKITYTAQIKSSMDYFCISCHSTASKTKGVVLDTYAGLKEAAANKNFMGAINHEKGYTPMPPNLGGAKLSPETIRDLSSWIGNGMPE